MLESAPRFLRYVEDSEGEDVAPTVQSCTMEIPDLINQFHYHLLQALWDSLDMEELRYPIRYRGESEDWTFIIIIIDVIWSLQSMNTSKL